ncbi:MAG: biotin carboxylase N-terminal domain-containing protein, partial [Thermosphaera sp.]
MSFRIFIANRGEIAIRIARTALENGFVPIGVYTKEDEQSLHRKYLKEDREVSSYLDIEEIVEAAQELGADAVHPGYGFLSENPEFAREVARRNIAFIGPSPSAMELSGDKLKAKEVASKLGIPTLPWMIVKDEKDVLEFAREHGFPILIKAVGGGGG